METDQAKFRCQVCGREFDPDPRMICEGEWIAVAIPIDAETPGWALTPDEFAEMDTGELHAVGIEPEDRDKLLSGQKSTRTALCICLECQDEANGGDAC